MIDTDILTRINPGLEDGYLALYIDKSIEHSKAVLKKFSAKAHG